MKEKRESFFWTSYSDLMTSLFFVMLVLFVLTIALLNKKMVEIDGERIATQAQLDRINEVEKATQNIDFKYFEYRPEYKKHKLKIEVSFGIGNAEMDLEDSSREQLENAGNSIQRFIRENKKHNVQYLLIIEGQASREMSVLYERNYELSYERALALKKFWESCNIDFGKTCEVLICGSGDGSLSGTNFMREKDFINNRPNTANQRFLIYIVPKFGIK